MKEEGNQDYEHTFISYPHNVREIVGELRKEKSLSEIQNESDKNKDFEFDVR